MTFAIELNNIGVSFLTSGNLDEAFESFKVAVELMKQVTAQREHRFVRRRSVTYPLSILKAKYEQGLDQPDEFLTEPSSACFVSKSPIMLPEGVTFSDDSWESSVLIFNLALSLHLMGLEPGMEMFLQKALKLYRLSKKLITKHLEDDMDDDMNDDNETSCINTRLVMSILNNVGHIYYLLGEYNTSRAYFSGLTNMVSRNARQRIDSLELEGLLLNAIVLTEPVVAAAA